jgi:hypothetical protein
MDIGHIDTPDDLHLWLRGKPPIWAAEIATRIALRVLPAVGRMDDDWTMEKILGSFKLGAIAWGATALNIRSSEELEISEAAKQLLVPARHGNGAIYAIDAIMVAAATALETTNREFSISENEINQLAVKCFHMATISMGMGESTSDDCRWLNLNKDKSDDAASLSWKKIWLRGIPRSRLNE